MILAYTDGTETDLGRVRGEDGHTPAPVIARGGGGLKRRKKVKTVTADYTVQANDDVVKVDATAGTVTITLPDAADYSGKEFKIKKVDSTSNAVTITSVSAIDGSTTITLTGPQTAVEVMGDDDGEYIIQ